MIHAIRPARVDDIYRLQDVERSAGELFLGVPGLEWIARDSVLSEADHTRFISLGMCWVSMDEAGDAVGFVSAEPLDRDMHVAELAVHAACQGQGRGGGLLRRVVEAARARNMPGVTLTTFRDVPWNAPFYARLGFRILPAQELGRRLQSVLAEEMERGLPAERRCAMRLDLEG